MSFNIAAATSIVTGFNLMVYGGYHYITARQKPVDEINQQKKVSLGCVAAGVAAIAVGTGLLYSAGTTSQNVIPLPKDDAVISKEVANCPIEKLQDILKAGRKGSTTDEAFKIFKESQGISCDNYLPWDEKFYAVGRGEEDPSGRGDIDGITLEHLKKPAMWGIDPWNRPYMAIKYACTTQSDKNDSYEGALTLFQYRRESGMDLLSGQTCTFSCLAPLEPYFSLKKEFLDNFTSFFKREDVLSTSKIFGRIQILKLAE